MDAALAEVSGTPEVAAFAEPHKRRAPKKRMTLSPDDSRRKRNTDRTKPFNRLAPQPYEL